MFCLPFVDFSVKSRQDQRETGVGRVRRRSPEDVEERRQGGPLQGPLRHWSLSDSEYAEENVDFGVFECLQQGRLVGIKLLCSAVKVRLLVAEDRN